MPTPRKDSLRHRTPRAAAPVLALAASFAAGSGAGRAAETAEDFTAALTGGEMQISGNSVVNGAPTTDISDSPWMPTVGVRVGARLRLLGAGSINSVGYTFGLVRYFNLPDQPIAGFTFARYTTTHEANIISDQTLTARHRLLLGLNGSVYSLAGLPIDVATATPGSAAVTAGDTHILTIAGGETWLYEPTGTHRYLQTLLATYIRPIEKSTMVPATVPETLQLLVTERGERQQGLNIYSLTLQVGDLIRLDNPSGQTSNFAGSDVYTGQLLAGLGRELWPTTRIEARAGVMALYSPGLDTLAVGPAADVSLAYRRNPWYLTLIAAHGPTMNGYVASAVVSDSVMLRAALPLNVAETLTISGVGGYAYSRSVIAGNGTSNGFSNTSKLYDVITLGGYATYQFTRAPLNISLEYSVIDQRGYANPDAFAPSIRRRYLGIAMSGNLSTDRRPVPQATIH
ncbi:MAG TPA: hypothetical protein VMU50_18945 [Polyangia bacterium]|nr:hypothetical protein [Polyangia bacterium]